VARPAYRAWRFTHPDFAREGERPGLAISPRGNVDMVQDDESVRQAILLLLTTRPGERIMRPTYGSELFKLTFWPNDDTTAGLAIHYVEQAIKQWEPRVDIIRLDAQRDPERPERLDVSLDYRVRATQRVAQLTIPLGLGGLL